MVTLEDAVTRDSAHTLFCRYGGHDRGRRFPRAICGRNIDSGRSFRLGDRAPRCRPASRRLCAVTVFLGCALFVPSLWLVRNASTAAPYVLGPRTIVGDGIDGLARLFAVSFGSLFVPSDWTHNALVIVIPVVLLAAAFSDSPRGQHGTAGEMDALCSRSHRSSSSIRCSSSGPQSCRVRASTAASWRRSTRRP